MFSGFLTARRAIRSGIFSVMMLCAIHPVAAQPPSMPGADTARARLAPLKWLVGEWAGPATISSGGRTFTLTQRETVQEAANGTVLMIRGRGSMLDASKVEREVFQAAGLLTYDIGLRRFTWVSSGGTGHLGVTEALVTDSAFVWSTGDRGNMKTRYTITRTPAGEWYEVGEESSDGVTWKRTIEMRLVKH
ncbi:MAG: hypothetical protein H7099_11875 [Gemmatimonadaceae bacterium]|nr:hypothetical protein [Gemmatimonadaceae bacterium]